MLLNAFHFVLFSHCVSHSNLNLILVKGISVNGTFREDHSFNRSSDREVIV